LGTLTNLFEVLKDTRHEAVQDEANREVAIAIAGNNSDVRDRLHRALSTRLESLWTPSPFRLVDSGELPQISQSEDEDGGLLLYALASGTRIAGEKRQWLRELALSDKVTVMLVILEKAGDEPFDQRRVPPRMNPLRLVGGKDGGRMSGPAADGAAIGGGNDSRPSWQVEVEELIGESERKIQMVELPGLELAQLQSVLLPIIVKALPGRELALARRAPIFRNTVANHLITQAAIGNAQTTLLSNAVGIVPVLADVLSSGADFVLLTRNQFELSHRLAAIYGQKRETKTEVYLEILPVIVAALVWRTLSAQATKKFHPILAMLPKAAIAFAATMATGILAKYYYSTGRKAASQLSGVVRNVYESVSRQPSDAPSPGDAPRNLRSS
jgi:uncharacterized protein (DUF697 family)